MPKVGKFRLNTPSCLELKGSLLCSREIGISAGQHDELLFVMPFSDLSKYCRLKSRDPRRNQKFQQQVRSYWTEWSKKRHESSTTHEVASLISITVPLYVTYCLLKFNHVLRVQINIQMVLSWVQDLENPIQSCVI